MVHPKFLSKYKISHNTFIPELRGFKIQPPNQPTKTKPKGKDISAIVNKAKQKHHRKNTT